MKEQHSLSHLGQYPIYPPEPNDWLKSQAPVEQQVKSDLKFDGIEVNDSGQLVNIPVVYGYRRVVGPRVLTRTKIDNTNILYCAIIVSEGRISKFDKILIDDYPYNIDGVGNNTRYILPGGPYSNLVEIQPYFGDGGNTIPSLLTEATGNEQDFRNFADSMRGIAYCVVKLTYSAGNTPFKNFPKISFDVCGRRLRPANTLGAEQQILSNANPADVLVDYLTNTTYGLGIADSRLDTTSLGTLRSSFDVTVIPYINGTAIKRAQCNYILETSRPALENVREICRQFGIIMTLANGLYRFIPEYTSSTFVMTANEDNIIDGWTESIPDLSVKYNKVNVTHPDQTAQFVEYTQSYSDADALVDDGKLLELNIRADAITNPYIARFLAEQILRKSRVQRIYTFRMTKAALRLTVGDIIQWDPESTGSSSTTLRIIGLTMNDDLTFSVEAVTHRNDLYPPFSPRNVVPPRIEIQPGPVPIIPPIDITEPPRIFYPPEQPQGDQYRKITVTASGKTGWTGQPPKLTGSIGTDFYLGPIVRINRTLAAIADNNYQLDNLSFSINNTYNNFGIDCRVFQLNRNIVWGEWRPIISYRDLALDRQGGEALFTYGAANYPKIYYAYEFERVNGVAQYGCVNRTSTNGPTYERLYLDPDLGGNTVTAQVGSSTSPGIKYTYEANKVVAGQAFEPGAFRSRFGFPYLEYNSDGYYSVPAFGSGLKYIFKGATSYSAADTQLYNIFNSSWGPRQNQTEGSQEQLMTIKFFILKGDGYIQSIGSTTVNLDTKRMGDSGLLQISISRTNYRLFTSPAPF